MVRSIRAWNELTDELLTPDDKEKFEWAVGAVLTGGPPNVVVLHGSAQTGKTTLLTLVRHILTRFVSNVSPRVVFLVNEERPLFPIEPDTHLFIESNSTYPKDALVIRPVGGHIPANKYHVLMTQIEFELNGIAKVCVDRYRTLGEK